jgi:hypothetical protein
MGERVFRFYAGRLIRNFIGLIPLVAFPVALHLVGYDDPALIGFFAVLALGFVFTVIFTAIRFRMVVNEVGITCRGRVHTRNIPFEKITGAFIRQGRDKADRFMGPPPFRELVLHTNDRKLVISSLPLGPDAFDELLSRLADHLADDVLDVQTQSG